jgi:hypothetical protein
MFRGKMADTTLLLQNPIVLKNNYQTSLYGPEACLVYYYNEDSAVYFMNSSYVLTQQSTSLPYDNSFMLCH